MTARISVIIPAYQAAPFLKEAVDSAMMQEETLEVIVIDDASTDQTGAVMEILMEAYGSKLVYEVNPENRGPGACRNRGIQLAQGPYISFLDADDYFLPGRFALAIRLLAQRTEADGCFTRVQNVWQDDFRPAAFDHQDIIGYAGKACSQKDLLYYILAEKGDFFSVIALVIKKSSLLKTSLFDESFKYGGDIEFIYELAYHCHLLPEQDTAIKIIRRLHGHNITSSQGHREFNDRWRLITKWVDHIRDYKFEPRTSRALVMRYLHFWYVMKGYSKTLRGRQLIKLGLLLLLLLQRPYLIKKCTLG